MTVDELVACVNIGLGNSELAACAACDATADGAVTINELIRAVSALLTGCPDAIPLPGTCRRPRTGGLGPCSQGSRITVYKCTQRDSCLRSPDGRVQVGEAMVGADGSFAVLVDSQQTAGAILMFEAEADDATVFRLMDLGPVSSDARIGSGAGVAIAVIDPAAEAATRLLDESGLENFSDAGVLEVVEAVRIANATLDFSGLSAGAAADLATATARDDAQVQAALRRNATPTRTRTAGPTEPVASATPPRSVTATPSATLAASATPVETATASPTPSPTLPPIFGPMQLLESGARPSAVAIAFLNNDLVPDLICANADSFDVSVWLGLPGGGFADRQDFTVGAGTFPAALVVVDLNGDDIVDVATADSFTDQVSVLLGTGDGSFGLPTRYEVGVTPSAIAAGQLSGDARSDLVVANRNFESVSLLTATESGFEPQVRFAAGVSPVGVALLDLDNDARLDLITANLDSDNLSVLRGSEEDIFAPQTRFLAGDGPAALAVGKLDGNDASDIVAANANAGEVAVFLRSQPGAELPLPQRYAAGDGPLSVAIADLDGDGFNDLITANAVSEDVSVLFGDGSGAFAPARHVPVGNRPVAVAVGDLDGDGAPDVVVANRNSDHVTLLPGLPRTP